MPLERASCQSHVALEAFYEEMAGSTDTITEEVRRSMLDLLPLLRDVLDPVEVWGLTSLSRLVLLATDDYTGV
jgi:hypothetical protein